MVQKKILDKCKKIQLIISDVDGVLTDGGMYYSEKGEELKKFNTKDGMAVEILKKYQIPVILMTKEKSKIALQRAKKIGAKSFIGINDKAKKMPEICREYNVSLNEIAYVGDDINDLEIMKKVGFAASPHNGIDVIKKNSHYVCKLDGGEGVLREVTELIISSKSNIK